jgi:hypothetical protein
LSAKKSRPSGRQTTDPPASDRTTGLYGRRFHTDEVSDLELLLDGSLDSEIAMLRVVTRRFFERSSQDEDMAEAADTLGVLGLAVTRLSCLLKVQKLLGTGDEHSLQLIQRAILEASKEMELRL